MDMLIEVGGIPHHVRIDDEVLKDILAPKKEPREVPEELEGLSLKRQALGLLDMGWSISEIAASLKRPYQAVYALSRR